jgi:hypothetical protein
MSDDKLSIDYTAVNESLIKRESIKHERAKDRAEALQSNMTKGLAAALKTAKQKLAKDATNAVNRQESGQLSPNEQKMIEAAQKGLEVVRIDEGVITGFDMPAFLRGDDDGDF